MINRFGIEMPKNESIAMMVREILSRTLPNMNNRSTEKNNTQPKRRLLRIGPGLIIALIVSMFIGYNWYTTIQSRPVSDTPPIVERSVFSSPEQEKLGPTPVVKFIIDRQIKIGLNSSQATKISELNTEWKKLYEPKLAEANKAAANAGKYLADAKGQSRTPSAHIQNEAAPLISLSREISSARSRYWDKAMQILTPKQRVIVQKEREIFWAARKKNPTTH